MTRSERQDLLHICRQRERVAKAEAVAVAARRLAEFEAQLATVYDYDNDNVWRAAHQAAKEATQQANEQIAVRCRQLGIPRRFQPELLEPRWWGRGENSVRERRAELTKVAHSQMDQLLKEAKHVIERTSVEIQTRLVADGLTSTDAKAFLEAMPAPDQLLPLISVEDVQQQLERRAGGCQTNKTIEDLEP